MLRRKRRTYRVHFKKEQQIETMKKEKERKTRKSLTSRRRTSSKKPHLEDKSEKLAAKIAEYKKIERNCWSI